MCGIVGIQGLDAGAVRNSVRSLRHRGPDASAVWTDGKSISLGHSRLSIIDLSATANQPMHCARTGNVVVFNGEIYNYRQIRNELRGLGWSFHTSSDTEVLLASYGQWGQACFQRLQGMFALAIFDQASGRVVLARDRIGKKPLFYSLAGGALAWGSEIKAVFELRPSLPRRGNLSALRSYMDLGYVAGTDTIYADIHKLPPGHFATFDLGRRTLQLTRYWRLPCPDPGAPIAEKEAAELLERLLVDAIRLRLESDVPLGIFLSGGLDSSIVATLAGRLRPGILAYTVRFLSRKFDESQVAAQVARHANLTHQVITVDEGDGAVLEGVLRSFDEPFADSSLLPTYLISRETRRQVTVALSGDGGDELFAGYDIYDRVLAESFLDHVPRGIRNALGGAHKLLRVGTPGKNFLRRLPLRWDERFLHLYRSPEELKEAFLRPELQLELDRLPVDGFRSRLAAEDSCGSQKLSPLQRMTRVDAMTYLPDDVLAKVDRASMLASLEVRSPLLDFRIVELAYRLPDQLRYFRGERKRLLKSIGRKILPPAFPFEQKRGFSIPEAEWIRGKWRPMFEDAFAKSSLLNTHNAIALLREHDRTGRHSRTLFKLFSLAVFERHSGIRFA